MALPSARSADRASLRAQAGVFAGLFTNGFLTLVLVSALPDVAADLGTSELVLGWAVSTPMIVTASALPILGSLGDRYGHRRLYLVGFLVATAASLLSAASWNAASLIVFRTVAIGAGAATYPAGGALLVGAAPAEQRLRVMGRWALVSTGSPVVGLVAGGPLVDALGWRSMFVAQGVLATGVFLVSALVLADSSRAATPPRFDVAGAVVLATTTASILVGLNLAGEGSGELWLVGALACAGAAGVMALVRIERTSPAPILPPRLLRSPTFAVPITLSFGIAGVTYGSFVVTPLLLRRELDHGAASTALLVAALPLAVSLSAPIGSRAAERLGSAAAVRLGCGSLALAMTALCLGAWAELEAAIVAGLVLQGLGDGLSRASIVAAVASAGPDGDVGTRMATQRTVALIGQAAGVTACLTAIGAVAGPAGYRWCYVVAAAVAASGVVAMSTGRWIRAFGDARGAPRQVTATVAPID